MSSLRLKSLVPQTLERMSSLDADKVLELRREVLGNREEEQQPLNTKDFTMKFSMKILRGIYSPSEIASWYRRYGCNDNHVLRLAIHCCAVKGWLYGCNR